MLIVDKLSYGQNNIIKNPCPIEADIWVLAGQSQMAGAGREPDTTTNPNIMMLNMDNSWMIAQEPLHRIFETTAPAYEICYCDLLPEPLKNSEEGHEQYRKLAVQSKENPVGGIGPGMYFAKHVYKNTDKPIGLIPSALGGSRMDQWYPRLKSQGDSSLYGAMINRIHSVGIENIKGFIWSQGESEAMILKTEEYEGYLLNLIKSVRDEVKNPELPVLLVQCGRFIHYDTKQDRTWEEIREIQRRVAQITQNVYMVTGIDLPLDDCAHISTDGQKRLGKRLAEIALTYVYEQPGHAKQIELESIKMCKDDKTGSNYLQLHYNGVCGKLSACGRPAQFELRVNGEPCIEWVVAKVELDDEDPAGLKLYLSAVPDEPAQLICGNGTNPYMNITDSLDNPIPAFGPIDIPLK
jgi:sialate O-acetylesterase